MNAPRISLLVPSRGPVDELLRLLRSARAMATDPGTVEHVIRCDDDDPQLQARLAAIEALGGGRAIVGPRWQGYSSLSAMLNHAASVAAGRWLFLLDDDAEFVKAGWDAALPPESDDTVAAAHYGPSVPFWAVTRAWAEAIGGRPIDGTPWDAWLHNVVPPEFLIGGLGTQMSRIAARRYRGFGAVHYIEHYYKPREAARNAGADPLASPPVPPPAEYACRPAVDAEEIRRRIEAWKAAR